jgi:hypothetical protein
MEGGKGAVGEREYIFFVAEDNISNCIIQSTDLKEKNEILSTLNIGDCLANISLKRNSNNPQPA